MSDAAPAPSDTWPVGIGHDRTARRILIEAAALFARRGVHGTTMRDIADRCGIRAPSIYEHFRSKEHLVGELMRIGHDTALSHFDDAMRSAPEDHEGRLGAAVDALVDLHTRYPTLLRVLTDDVHGLSPEVTEPAISLRMEMSLRLAQVLLDGERDEVFAFPNLVPTVAAIHGLFIRIPHWFHDGDGYGIAQLCSDYRALVLNMVRAR